MNARGKKEANSQTPVAIEEPVQSSRLAMLLLVLVACSVAAMAQWLNYPTPGIPRLANGVPDLKAPAPRTSVPNADLEFRKSI